MSIVYYVLNQAVELHFKKGEELEIKKLTRTVDLVSRFNKGTLVIFNKRQDNDIS